MRNKRAQITASFMLVVFKLRVFRNVSFRFAPKTIAQTTTINGPLAWPGLVDLLLFVYFALANYLNGKKRKENELSQKKHTNVRQNTHTKCRLN